jgi:innexin
MDIIESLRNLSVSKRRSLKDDDFFVDRLHHRYTVAALVLFCVVVTTNQYAGEPITCWVPAQFTGSFEAYTNRLCWLQNTYYIDEDNDIPDKSEIRYKDMLKYYQWIHLIILVQAMVFLIPRIIWRTLNDKCGIEIVNYVDAAQKYETVDSFRDRANIMEFLSSHITTFIRVRSPKKVGNTWKDKMRYASKQTASWIFFWTNKRFGNYLIILYMLCKILYCVNVFGQLFLMTKILGIENYHSFGLEMLMRMSKGVDMIKNEYFPKVTHCDFKVRELGTDHQYTVTKNN